VRAWPSLAAGLHPAVWGLHLRPHAPHEEPQPEAEFGNKPDRPRRIADRGVRRGEQHLEEPDEHRDTVEEEEPSEDTGQEPGAQHQPAEGEKPRGEEQLGRDEPDPVRADR